MGTINETDILNELIVTTKKKRAYELGLVKNQLHEICESFRPFNLIKTVLHEATNSPEIKNNLINSGTGLRSRIFLKKLFTGNSDNLGKKMMEKFIQFSVANLVSKHYDEIKKIARDLFDQISESEIIKKDYRKKWTPNLKISS